MFLTDHSHRHHYHQPTPPLPDEDDHHRLLLLSFESSLRRRLRSLLLLLLPPPLLSLRHLSLAASAAVSTVSEASPLLSHPFASTSLLDSCNAASSVIRLHLRHRLPLLHALRLLSSPSPTPDALARAKSSLSEWENHHQTDPIGIPKILISDSPEDSATCAVGAVGHLALATILGTLGRVEVPEVKVPQALRWAGELEEVNAVLRGEIKRGPITVEEVEAAREAVRGLRVAMMDNNKEKAELKGRVKALEEAMGSLTSGLEGLAAAVDALFRAVMGTRNAAFDRFRTGMGWDGICSCK